MTKIQLVNELTSALMSKVGGTVMLSASVVEEVIQRLDVRPTTSKHKYRLSAKQVAHYNTYVNLYGAAHVTVDIRTNGIGPIVTLVVNAANGNRFMFDITEVDKW